MLQADDIREWCHAQYGTEFAPEEITIFIGECVAMNLDPRMRPRVVIMRRTPDGRVYAHRVTSYMQAVADEKLMAAGKRGTFQREEIYIVGFTDEHTAKCAEYGLDANGDMLAFVRFEIDERREYYAEVERRFAVAVEQIGGKLTYKQRLDIRAEIFQQLGEPPRPREYVGIGLLPISAPHDSTGRRRITRQERVVTLAKRDAIDQAFPTLFREVAP